MLNEAFPDSQFPALPSVNGEAGGWTKVGKPVKTPVKVKKESLKIAAEIEKKKEKDYVMGQWRKEMMEKEEREKERIVSSHAESKSLKFIKEASQPMPMNGFNRAQFLAAAPLGQMLPQTSPQAPGKQKLDRKRLKSASKPAPEMNEFERIRRKAAEELKQRLDAKV